MPLFLLALTSGIFIIGFLSHLPELSWLALILPLGVLPGFLLFLNKSRRLILVLTGLALGAGWGIISGHALVANLLAPDLVGQDFVIRGRVIDLPVEDARRQRFILAVESAHQLDGTPLHTGIPSNVQVSWYEKDKRTVKSGERWQFVVRLKRPRGFANPGGFDYQVWLMRRDIGGIGYVRSDPDNQRVAPASRWEIDVWRYQLREWLLESEKRSQTGIMLGLLIGDRSLIEPEQWRKMQLTGIGHLISISGLHVGFLAICGFFVGLLVGRGLNLIWHTCPALLIGYGLAMVFALVYSALAGFNIPTQRTLLMILIIQLASFSRRSYHIGHVFLMALTAVVIHDPLAAYDLGFWLSFGAVAVLLVGFSGRFGLRKTSSLQRMWQPVGDLLRSQWIIFFGLFLPLTLLFSSISLLAPIANLIAVPLVTFAVVPLLLFAAACHWSLPGLADFLITLVDHTLRLLDGWLMLLINASSGMLNPVITLNGWAFLLALLATFVLLLPQGLPGRWLGYPSLIVALLLPDRTAPALVITVLDVGQGLAVVVQTPKHQLIYDAGPGYSERFDAGRAIVVPFLYSQGIDSIDTLIISHGDQDHAGGLQGVLEGVAVGQLLVGEADKTLERFSGGEVLQGIDVQGCHDYPAWQWDEVRFQFLTLAEAHRNNSNNRSCVLLVEYTGQRILFPGDIEARGEIDLITSGQLPQELTLVLAAHHGSRSSSSMEFVSHSSPEVVVFSAGYRSQHGHPHSQVTARFAITGSRSFNTAESGALQFVWHEQKLQPIVQSRVAQRRYWFYD